MNRIDAIFGQLRRRGGKALMPYLTAGDPDLPTTGRLIEQLEPAGASICELGFPFSDPIADGPVIQASMTYALDRQLRPRQVLETVRELRSRTGIGLVAMLSYSIVHRLGDGFLADAKAAGFDGFIIPDLTVEEGERVADDLRKQELICSFLIAPSTSLDRAQRIAKASSGFVYLLSRAGITGEKSALPPDLPQRISALRDVTNLPIAVGFGIGNAQQVSQVTAVADAAIVGSAIMRQVAQVRAQGPAAVVEAVGQFVRELATGLPQPTPAGR